MKFSNRAGVLDPDFGKSNVEVFRDSVEAGFVHFQNTDVLLYRTGNEAPSWIQRWDQPMIFGIRFGLEKESHGNAQGKRNESGILIRP